MAGQTHDLGLVERILADAVGLPGQRRFRLQAASDTGHALIWMEREQIQGLALTIEQILTQIQLQLRGRAATVKPATLPTTMGGQPTLEFTAGQIGVGYDAEPDLLALEIESIEASLEPGEGALAAAEAPTVVFQCTRAVAAAVRDQCEATLRAGRPRCPLCGAPLEADGTHFCHRSNGHAH